MSILLFILLLSLTLTNVAIGCYAAILLGYGPPTLKDAINELIDENRVRDFLDDLRSRFKAFRGRKHSAKTEEAPIEAEPEPLVTEAAPSRETLDDIIQRITNADLSDLLDDESDSITQIAPMQELFDDGLASILMEQGTEAWLMNEKHVETSLLKLNVVMMKSGRFAADLDMRLREMRARPNVDEIKTCLNELRDDCRNYLDAQATTTEQMLNRLDEFGELKYLAEEIDYANMEQSAQIETTINNLNNLKVSANPEEAIGRLLKELSSLRIARHRLRDMQEKAYIKVVLYENRLDTVPQQLYFGETTGLRSRIGIDAAIFEWWRQKRQEKRQITFALLDFAEFGAANDEHGILRCDKIIKLFGKSLEDTFDSLDLVGLYTGECFMVATMNIGPKKTVTEIERIRQRCEKTFYTYDNGTKKIRLQLTCAITEALPTQQSTDIPKILEQTLAAAKKAGRNTTFMFDSSQLSPAPEKVDAPNLGELDKEIKLDVEM